MRTHAAWLLGVVVAVALLARWQAPAGKPQQAVNDVDGVSLAVNRYLRPPSEGVSWRVQITQVSFDDADHAAVAAQVLHGGRKSAPLTLDLVRRDGAWKVTSVKGIPQTPL